MFRLVKCLGGRINEAETRKIKVNAIAGAIARGTPVRIKNGSVTSLSQTGAVIATHLAERDAKAGDTELLVSEILPGMVFEAPLAGAPAGAMKVWGEYTTDGQKMLTAAADSTNTRGVIIYDLLGAKAAGDMILVTFPVA